MGKTQLPVNYCWAVDDQTKCLVPPTVASLLLIKIAIFIFTINGIFYTRKNMHRVVFSSSSDTCLWNCTYTGKGAVQSGHLHWIKEKTQRLACDICCRGPTSPSRNLWHMSQAANHCFNLVSVTRCLVQAKGFLFCFETRHWLKHLIEAGYKAPATWTSIRELIQFNLSLKR